jgi:exosortase
MNVKRLDSDRKILRGAAAIGLAALALLYHRIGVSVWAGSNPSIYRWLSIMWGSEANAAVDYSHGYIIPFVSLWLLWRRRAALCKAPARPHGFGPVLWAAALGAHFIGLRSQIPHLSAVSFIAALWALVWTFFGAQAARLTFFPLLFLLFAVPVGFLAQATFPLRLFGSIAATSILNGLGVETARRGTAVLSSVGQGFALDVADPCSGIRSLMTLMALTAGYAYVFRKHNGARALLFALSLPIAVIANIGRIVTIALVAVLLGQETGMKLYHDYSGYLVFLIAVLLVMAADSGLTRVARRAAQVRRWRRAGRERIQKPEGSISKAGNERLNRA